MTDTGFIRILYIEIRERFTSKKDNEMKAKTIYLSINEKGLLEVLDYETMNLELTLDIMNEYDASLEKWEEIKDEFELLAKTYYVSSSIDFSEEFGVDGAVLNSFINSMITFTIPMKDFVELT